MLTGFKRLVLMASFLASPALGADCGAVDFMTLPLPSGGDPAETALRVAYPGLTIDAGKVTLPGGATFLMGEDSSRAPADRLADPSLREQFHDVYPLAFDLAARETPWFDPGRPRVEAFFQALYGESEAAVRDRLEKAAIKGKATFLMNGQHGVACQMATALAAVEALSIDWSPFFKDVGGSFAWRPIAGTKRLSAHSYGIAFDLNAELGGYWRWSDRAEGDAGAYDNKIPQEIVEVFERFGFIWGGKWHHFDGMHFEYRPELILHARLMAR